MKNNSMVKINQIQINIAIVVLLLIISSVTIPSLPQEYHWIQNHMVFHIPNGQPNGGSGHSQYP